MIGKSFTTLIVAALAASSMVAAQPHGQLYRRKVVTVTKNVTTVYCDQYGSTLDPSNLPGPTTVTATAKYTPPPRVPPKPVAESSAPPKPVPETPLPLPDSNKPPTKPPSTRPRPPNKTPENSPPINPNPPKPKNPPTKLGPPSGQKPGITYSPWESDGNGWRKCKSASVMSSEIAKIKHFSPIRLYDTACNTVETILRETQTQLFIGVDGTGDANGEIQQLITCVGRNWGRIHTVAVGNEHLEFGRITLGDYVAKLKAARTSLEAAGYFGPIVAVETVNAWGAHTELCEVSDYVATNAHPYFASQSVNNVGVFMRSEMANVKSKVRAVCNKPIHFVESGWPSSGGAHGAAQPGVAEQGKAIQQIVEAMGNDIILFSAFDENWKKDTAATMMTEKHWGIRNLNI